MERKATSGIMLTLLLIGIYAVLLFPIFAVAPIQSQEEPQYVDLSYLVSHIEDFKGIIIMTNGTAVRHTEYHYGCFFLEAPNGTGIKVSLGGLPNQGLPANLTVVVVVGWVYYSSMLHEWEFEAESWWPQYADWITVKDLLVEMSIENTTTPLGEELSILMVAPEGGTCPDTQIFDVYLYYSNYSLFSYWSQDKGAYFVVTNVDPGYKETLRWDLHRYEGGEYFPPPPGDYYIVGAIMTGWDGILPTELTPPILIRIDNSTITPIAKPWTVDDDGPADFSSIQEAINAAHSGDTIFVHSGTYYENVVVNKTVSLIGENRSTTIIDGNATGAVIYVTAKDTKISGFTVQNSTSVPGYDAGIVVYNSRGNNIGYNIIRNNSNGIVPFESINNTIVGNVVSSNIEAGIRLWYSHGNNISGNTVSNNYVGISLVGAGANFLSNNDMTGNKFNLEVLGDSLSAYFQDIDSSNKVDGKPVYYLLNQSDKQIPSDAGFVAAVNSTNIIVRDLDVTRNGIGILFAYTRQSTIKNVNVSNNGDGIRLFWSSNNTVYDNTITSNRGNGIELYKESKHNNIYENKMKNACIYLRESPSNSISGNNITNSEFGIFLSVSHYNIVSGNNIANNSEGIELRYSSNNVLSGNNVTANNGNGILFFMSMNNSITGNNIVDNKHAGIYLQSSSSNNITGNTIAYNVDGLGLYESSSNSIFHNDFIYNTNQLYLKSDSVNAWDHFNEGNYWSDYAGVDLYGGPHQNETGSDGIGDTPYFIDEDNQDKYPLMSPWVSPEAVTFSSPFWVQWWFWTIVVAGIIALAGAIYFVKKRKPPTPIIPTPPTEGIETTLE